MVSKWDPLLGAEAQEAFKIVVQRLLMAAPPLKQLSTADG